MTASDPGNPPVTAGDGGMSNKNQHWGSTLDDFLHEEGIYGAAKAKAVKLEQLGKIFAMDLTAVTLRHGTPKK